MTVSSTALLVTLTSIQQIALGSVEWNITCPSQCQCVAAIFNDESILDHIHRSITCQSIDHRNISLIIGSVPRDVTKLVLTHSHLQSIADICIFEDLIHLDVSNNDITTVLAYEVYAVFERLHYLNLAHNQLRILRREEFVSFPNLQILDLSYNFIISIHEESFRLLGLKELILHHNQIVHISDRMFRYTPLLRSLDFSGNNLSYIHNRNFFYLQNTQTLNLSYNQIRLVDEGAFIPLFNLEVLDLSDNQIRKFPSNQLIPLKKLKRFSFDGNDLVLLEAGAIQNLTVQELSLSRMPSLRLVLKMSFANMPNLVTVTISNNEHLCYFSHIAFDNTPLLQYLILRNNNLHAVSKIIFSLPSLKMLDITENPLNCDNLMTKTQPSDTSPLNQDSIRCLPSKPHQNKLPTICSSSDTVATSVKLGSTVRLYCASSADGPVTTTWLYPLSESRHYSVTDEYLEIHNVQSQHEGTVNCTVSSENKRAVKSFGIEVLTPKVTVYPVLIGDTYIVVEWNTSSLFTDMQKFRLTCQETGSQAVWEGVSLRALFRSHRFSSLKPNSNYTICVYYKPHAEIVYQQCSEVTTRNLPIPSRGIRIDYTFLVAIVGFSSFIFAVCIARCVYRRFHIWQREKWHSRIQESLSAQGILSSLDSLTSTGVVGVTYENLHMDCAAEAAQEGVEEETAALVDPGPSTSTAPPVAVAVRKIVTNGVMDRSKQCLTSLTDTSF